MKHTNKDATEHYRFAHKSIYWLRKRAKSLRALRQYDAVIILVDSLRKTRQIVDDIRHHRDLHIALMPVYVSTQATLPPDLLASIDGVIPVGDPVTAHYDDVMKINRFLGRIKSCKELEKVHAGAALTRHILHSASRAHENTSPIPSAQHHLGYFRPCLDRLTDFHSTPVDPSCARELAKQQILNSTVVDVAYLCPHCQGGHVQIRESCPKCSSVDLKTQDLVHHFRCAHVGPIDNFEREDGWQRHLQCPKCEKTLKHIGVDYDKPSEISECQGCQHIFQAPNMMARCCHCGENQNVEELMRYPIEAYQLLVKPNELIRAFRNLHTRANRAQPSEWPEEVVRADLPGDVDWYHLSIENWDELQRQYGDQRARQIHFEIETVVRASIAKTDTLEAKAGGFWLTQQDRSPKEALQVLDRTCDLLRDLMNTNQRAHLELSYAARERPMVPVYATP